MLKNMKVTTKLVAILVAPVLVLVALAYVGVRQRQADANDAQRVLALTDFVASTTSLLKEVEFESLYASRYSGSSGAVAGTEYTQQQQKTDAAAAQFRKQVTDIDPAAGEPDVKDTIDSVTQRISALSTNRTSVSQRSTDGLINAKNYRYLADALRDTVDRVTKSLVNPQLAQRMKSVSNLVQLAVARSDTANRLAIAVEVGYFPEQLPKGSQGASKDNAGYGAGCSDKAAQAPANTCEIYRTIVRSDAEATKANEVLNDEGSAGDRAFLRADGDESQFTDMVGRAIASGQESNDLRAARIEPAAFSEAARRAITGLATTSEHILTDRGNPESVASIASGQASEAQQAAVVYFFFAAAAVVVAAAVTYSVGRSITVPLRRLTNAAYTLSTERLPALVERLRNPEEDSHESLAATLAPIDIHSRDEIGQLADSFNAIQQVTVEVAEEQSVLLRKGIGDIFINLARRNQTLLDRQIEFIDQLEANEEDPDQLDNLFKLDHLATRMRRNAESLLVLAGAEPPRRRGRPVALADVVRVAIGEVEDFARIQLLALDDATVGGNVAVDLAHLLSELMENATHFSPPDTMVEIVGHRSASGYIISVSDQGIGMSPEQLAEANHQLARPPLVGLALSRSLGFIVIGRLAQRFDISVKLTASPSGGVTGLVNLPTDLVTYEGEERPPTQASMPSAPSPHAPMAPVPDPGDVVVIDRDLSLVEERYDQRYDYEPPEPSYEPPTPSYEPDPSYQPVARADDRDDEFERGLQQILGEERDPHSIAGTISPTYDDPGAYAPPRRPTPPVRPEPIQTVAEQVAAASRAETLHAQTTAAGLVRRTPKKRADGAAGGGMPITQAPRVTTSTQRSPEEVRKMLSRYRSGLNKGRNSADPEKADS
jgi:signal transduction histidine kinase